MEKTKIIEPARLVELQDVLGKIPGADRKNWILEIFDENGRVVGRIDIRTGRPVRKDRESINLDSKFYRGAK